MSLSPTDLAPDNRASSDESCGSERRVKSQRPAVCVQPISVFILIDCVAIVGVCILLNESWMLVVEMLQKMWRLYR